MIQIGQEFWPNLVRLGARIAKHLEASLGYGIDSFVRTVEKGAGIGSAKVFAKLVRWELRSMSDFCSRIIERFWTNRFQRADAPLSNPSPFEFERARLDDRKR
jgi:hypothetical protein